MHNDDGSSTDVVGVQSPNRTNGYTFLGWEFEHLVEQLLLTPEIHSSNPICIIPCTISSTLIL